MGITKKPASNCSDEILVDIDDFVADATINIDSANEFEYVFLLGHNITTGDPNDYRSSSPESLLSYDSNNCTANVDSKPVVFKKKNISDMGRRKANRALNESYLLSLNIEQNSEDEIFFNNNKNGFTKAVNKLGNRPDLKQSFIEGKDELLLQKNRKHSSTNSSYDKKSKRSFRPDVAFKNLTTSQKSLFKQKSLPVAAINYLESEVVRYFSLVPNGIYRSEPLPSYHRVILHSIVRYYSLDAMSLNSRGQRAQKIVQVRNSFFDDFLPPKMSLLQFVLKPNCC